MIILCSLIAKLQYRHADTHGCIHACTDIHTHTHTYYAYIIAEPFTNKRNIIIYAFLKYFFSKVKYANIIIVNLYVYLTHKHLMWYNILCPRRFDYVSPVIRIIELSSELRCKIGICKSGRIVPLHEVHKCFVFFRLPVIPEPLGSKARDREYTPVNEDAKLRLIVP